MTKPRFISNNSIEDLAETRIRSYEEKWGKLPIPVPMEKLVGQLYKLTILWDEIEEEKNETILGGLNPEKRLIILNKARQSLFREKNGLEHSTIGHEAGHWEYDVDHKNSDHPILPGLEKQKFFLKRNSHDHGEIEVFSGSMCGDTFNYAKGKSRLDTADQERIVNRFSAALNIPKTSLRTVSREFNMVSWTGDKGLYSMAKYYGVTISALTVRLDQLHYIFIGEDKKIYKSRDEYFGQGQLLV